MTIGGRFAGLLIAGAVLATAPVFASQPTELAIEWRAPPAAPAVEVTGLTPATLQALAAETRSAEEWAALFAVLVEARPGQSVPPLAGTWRVAGDRLRFEPRFPWAQGVRYRAELRPAQLPGGASGRAPASARFELPPRAESPPTGVAQIYPAAAVLPENQLKFYVQFTGPMSRGGIYEHIHLRDEAGREIDQPFLEIGEELWDPAMTRLTLLIDPGRIKRGVKPLEDIGAVFEAGKKYSLTIDAAWRDALGRPLAAAHRKDFRVGEADRTAPDPARWSVRPAAAGTRAPLVVIFDEPMDRALALRLISVVGPGGTVLAGEPGLADEDRRWSFTPGQPWTRGRHRLLVVNTIEDLAGNNIGKTFDVDMAAEGGARRIDRASVEVAFEVE